MNRQNLLITLADAAVTPRALDPPQQRGVGVVLLRWWACGVGWIEALQVGAYEVESVVWKWMNVPNM